MRAIASAPDPYAFNDNDYVAGNRATGAYQLVSPRLVPGEKTGVFFMLGQSNSPDANTVDVQYAPTHGAKVQMLNIYDGGIYVRKDPMLGSNALGGSWGGRLADKLITAGKYDRIITVPLGFGGSALSTWMPGQVGVHARLVAACLRAKALGLTPTAFFWHQGETDNAFGTTQAAYETGLHKVIASVRAVGLDAPWLISLATYIGGATSNPIRFAQTAMVNGVDIFQGPDTDQFAGSGYRQADDTHFNAAGAEAAANVSTAIIMSVL